MLGQSARAEMYEKAVEKGHNAIDPQARHLASRFLDKQHLFFDVDDMASITYPNASTEALLLAAYLLPISADKIQVNSGSVCPIYTAQSFLSLQSLLSSV